MVPDKDKSIGITIGDPAGIGPEIVARALSRPSIRRLAKFKVIGDIGVYRRYCKGDFPNVSFVDCGVISSQGCCPAEAGALTGEAAFTYIKKAISLIKTSEISAIVTAPVSKLAIQCAGHKFSGHTEFLAEAAGVDDVGMLFVAGSLRVIIVTRHIPLRDVSSFISKDKVFSTIKLLNEGLRSMFGIKIPCIAVCGLNPHAGEGGKIGIEEMDKIIPAMDLAKQSGIDVHGPYPADTIFVHGISERYDAIVAMYHDQGLIPVKSLAFNRTVNVTLGLPFIRTSPAHGTAFDIAGKGVADPSSMCEAIKLAARLLDINPDKR